jgi:hypothetical protein
VRLNWVEVEPAVDLIDDALDGRDATDTSPLVDA